MYKDISHIEEVISSFSTVFNSANVNRSHNIKLACERINNTVLLPGETFSMDASLGSRTKENGYKDAPVIVKGRLIEGVGGGVCQVTSTLYVAVLKAKLEVVERVKHSMPLDMWSQVRTQQYRKATSTSNSETIRIVPAL